MKLAVSVPISIKDETIGVLSAIWQEKNLSKENEITLVTFANQIATAIYNSQLFTQSQNQIISLENQNRDLASLFKLVSNISKSLDPYQVAQIAVNTIPIDDRISGIALGVYEPKTNALVVRAISQGPHYDKAKKIIGSMDNVSIKCDDPRTQDNPSIIAYKEKRETFSDNLATSFIPSIPRSILMPLLKVLPAKSSYQLPINVRGEVVGILAFYLKTATRKELTSNFVQLLRTYTNQIGIGLDNAYLFTRSKHIQSNLEKALAELQEARRKEKDMIDVMGHELRTPISIVRNSLMVLDSDNKKNGSVNPKKLDKYLDIAVESTKREIKLIETLLSTAKLEGKRVQLNLTKVSLSDVVHDAIEGNRSQSDVKNLELKLSIPQDIFVYADRVRVQEIMDNLLSNALKYTSQGGVTVSVYREGDFGRVDVIDTGVGISDEDIKQLGKKFFRAQTSFTGDFKGVKPGGTGLGLYVTFELIRVMGGQHFVKSSKGVGSTFSFTLPHYYGQPDKHFDQTFMNE